MRVKLTMVGEQHGGLGDGVDDRLLAALEAFADGLG